MKVLSIAVSKFYYDLSLATLEHSLVLKGLLHWANRSDSRTCTKCIYVYLLFRYNLWAFSCLTCQLNERHPNWCYIYGIISIKFYDRQHLVFGKCAVLSDHPSQTSWRWYGTWMDERQFAACTSKHWMWSHLFRGSFCSLKVALPIKRLDIPSF